MPKKSHISHRSRVSSLIKKPTGRPGPKTWTLIDKLGLKYDKAQYNAIQAYVRKKTRLLCNTNKGIQLQHPRAIFRVVDKACNKFEFLKNFENGWPVKEWMRVYLSNSAYQAKLNGNESDDDTSQGSISDCNGSNCDIVTEIGEYMAATTSVVEEGTGGEVKGRGRNRKNNPGSGKHRDQSIATRAASKDGGTQDSATSLAHHCNQVMPRRCNTTRQACQHAFTESFSPLSSNMADRDDIETGGDKRMVIGSGVKTTKKSTARPRSKQDPKLIPQIDLHMKAPMRKSGVIRDLLEALDSFEGEEFQFSFHV